MNQITGASQTTGLTTQQGPPPASFDRLDRIDNGFSPAIPGQTREAWLEQARTSTSPEMRAFYNELVTLAGGRTDDAALNQVLDLFQRRDAAETPREVGLVQRDMLDQFTTMLSRFDPLNNLLNAVQPQLADMTRAAGLGETAWGASLQKVLDTPGSAAAFNDGLRAGIVAGGKDMIVSTATMVGGLVRHQADTSVLGHGGDWLRSQTGPLPGALDAVTPSAARGAATSEALADMGGKIGTYLGAVADNPARLKTDIATVINAQWSRLEASHAAAAARGPQEEARWWGETVGRVTFEVAATVVPVAGQVGKVGTVAKVADRATDVVRAADTVGDAARIAGRVDDAGNAARVAGTGDEIASRVDEAPAPVVRTLDKFYEIAAKAKINMPHILDGHLNAKGKAVGFHSRPEGIDPLGSRMTEQTGLKNPQGVYEGKVEIRDPATGQWIAKTSNGGKSTFYPDHMTPKEIEAAVRNAYADALRKGEIAPDGEFVGQSGLEFEIRGFVRNNEIATAYPIR